MKNIFKIILLVLIFGVTADAQQVTWQKVLDYTDNSALYKAQQTSDSGYIAVGDSRVGIYGKIILVKFNKYGDTLWNKYFDLKVSAVYRGFWIEETFEKGFIITGSGEGPNSDAYLIKTDSYGNILWYNTFGGSGIDQGRCVKQTSDNGFILSIRTDSFSSTNDILLLKTDSSGNEVWRKLYGNNTYHEFGNEIQIIGNSGFIIAGWKNKINQPASLYLIRTNTNGDTIWTRTNNNYLVSAAYSVDLTNDNGFIIGGVADSTNNNYPLGYIVKTDSIGNIDWQKRYSSAFKEYCYSIKTLPNNRYAFCGMSDSTYFNFERAILRVIDGSGNILRERYYRSGINENSFQSVGLTNDNGFILCGYADFGLAESFIVRTDSLGNVNPVGISNNFELLKDYVMDQNYPNPFNPETKINFTIPKAEKVTLKVYDVLGNEVKTLVNEFRNAGSYQAIFNGINLSSGVYYYKIESGSFMQVRKMVLIK